MKVHELIAVLQELPLNADVYVNLGSAVEELGSDDISQEWDDSRENYVVVI